VAIRWERDEKFVRNMPKNATYLLRKERMEIRMILPRESCAVAKGENDGRSNRNPTKTYFWMCSAVAKLFRDHRIASG
jgi:hypothetical protein